MTNKFIKIILLIVCCVFITGCNDNEDIVTVNIDTDTKEIKVGDVKFRLKYVEAGPFFMGAQSSDTNGINYDKYADKYSTLHQVTLTKSYWIGETEVTHALWEAVMGKDNNPSFYLGSYQNPVNNVNYYKANEFIEQLNKKTGLNFRLPTEAEWEYAAKGGHKSTGFHRYSGSNNLDEVGWYNTNPLSTTLPKIAPTAQKKPNELGIYDMSGNVAEWCLGKFVISDGSPEVDPLEIMIDDAYPFIIRGGSSNSKEKYCTVFNRFPTTVLPDDVKCGVRLVLEDIIK